MTMKCSECGGIISKYKSGDKTILKCTKCGRERVIKEKVVETVDMSETAGLEVIME
jgi:DNA-directed RNA polymerase subunit M/transcription elongation factor TFIIS